MDNVLTLNKINRSDTSIAGFKAVDLAVLYEKRLNMPLCFVIKTKAFEEFLEDNNLQPNINRILSQTDYNNKESLNNSYEQIKELFEKIELSEEFQKELLEAYDTLTIDIDNIDVAKLVTAIERPFITLITSPAYIADSENNEGISDNIKGKNQLFKAVKNCWTSLYTPSALKYRKKNDIGEDVRTAIIVERMIEAEFSAITYCDEEEIIVKAFFGYQDYKEELEKDITVLSKQNLTIKNNKVNYQVYVLTRDIQDNTIVKKPLKEKGEEQKLNEKEITELARLTKRTEEFIEKPIKIFFAIRKGKNYILHCNRIIRTREAEEETIEDPTEKPILETYDTEEELNHDPDKEDLGIKEEDIPIEEDLAFLEQIEALEKKVVEEKQKEPEAQKTITGIEEEIPQETTEEETTPKPPEEDTPKPKETTEEEQEEEFIIRTDEEEKTQPKETTTELNLHPETKTIIEKSEKTITEAIRKKYNEIMNKDSEDMHEMIVVLKTMVNIPLEEDIRKVYELKQKENPDMEEATFATNTAKKFLEEFK